MRKKVLILKILLYIVLRITKLKMVAALKPQRENFSEGMKTDASLPLNTFWAGPLIALAGA